MKKFITKALLPTVSALAATAFCLCGCSRAGRDAAIIEYTRYDASTVAFNDNHDKALGNYDDSLYYLNEWGLGFSAPGQKAKFFPDMADPILIYEGGYYYAFGTRDTTVYQCFRSADLTEWERLQDAFVPESGSWSRTGLYAPDIQKIGDKWYLYYTATQYYGDEPRRCQLGVAIADNVYGPYKQYTGTNANGENITLSTPAFTGMEKHQVLDANVLQDDDGKLYMYFSYDTKTPSSFASDYADMSKDKYAAEIWGVELKDPVTWDLSTVTPLATPGYKTYDAPRRTIDWETFSDVEGPGYGILEGPFTIKHGGKYILTYSANLYTHDCYSVGYAVADSPLGPFVKPTDEYMQNMLLGVPDAPGSGIANNYKGFTKGTGHAGIIKMSSGEYMFAYHAHFNRTEWGNTAPDNYRALALDYIYFDDDGLPYTNGPTYSLQSKPTCLSGCRNLAGAATIRIDGKNAEYLNDNYTNRAFGVRANKNPVEVAKEATFKAGTRSIEIKFVKPVTLKALNVFNSYDYDKAVYKIDQIDFGGGKGIVDVLFNQRYVNESREFIFPHSAFNIELRETVTTDKIVITVTSGSDFALGEIEVLCK